MICKWKKSYLIHNTQCASNFLKPYLSMVSSKFTITHKYYNNILLILQLLKHYLKYIYIFFNIWRNIYRPLSTHTMARPKLYQVHQHNNMCFSMLTLGKTDKINIRNKSKKSLIYIKYIISPYKNARKINQNTHNA